MLVDQGKNLLRFRPEEVIKVRSSKEIAERLAKKAGVGKTSVYSRKAVLEKGAPELIDLHASSVKTTIPP